MKKIITALFVSAFVFLTCQSPVSASSPLRIHPKNWRYFTDDTGKAIVFAGSHTWLRKEQDKHWVSDNWDIGAFNKYLDFSEYWGHNYIRLWMWEHRGEVEVWNTDSTGKYDLAQLNPAYFELVRSFVEAASSRGIYCGVMLFQGWSGCNIGSKPDWVNHPMNKANNVNGIDGDPEETGYGRKVHSLDNPEIVEFQEMYIGKMVETLNGFDNIIWEVGNEISHSGLLWKNHIVNYIREREREMPKQHLVLDGLAYGGSNDAEWVTKADVYCPGAMLEWSSHDEIYVTNPPVPDVRIKKPVILDNDHIGNIFPRFTVYEQRNWTWKAFTRGNHVLHMDSYNTGWEGQLPVANHPVEGAASHPHFDAQRKSLGDILRYTAKMDMENMLPCTDSTFCSTGFCLAGPGEYIIYQPDTAGNIAISVPRGKYQVESFDTVDSSTAVETIRWKGGKKIFAKPAHAGEDWVLLIQKQ
jgi:hypothetical protein